MHLKKSGFTFSASDLALFLSCRHLTALDLELAQGERSKPTFNNPHAEAIQSRGLEHEAQYVEHLRGKGLNVVTMSELEDSASAIERTLEAMRSGADVIVQATLELPPFMGRADILRKTSTPSKLGAWSYEAVDTKLAKDTKATSLLQLCLYSEMLEAIQGTRPEFAAIVPPSEDFATEEYRLDDFMAYYRMLKDNFLAHVHELSKKKSSTYPEPREHCDVCRWFETCDRQRRSDDHLSFVANLTSSQRQDLSEFVITKLEELAVTQVILPSDSLQRSREQARLQLLARTSGTPTFELLPLTPQRGLYRLPTPSPGDIFFDLEGDQFYGKKGLEYLWGYSFFEGTDLTHRSHWSFTPAEEKREFERFIQFVVERRREYPDLKIYHYAPYETTALGRLMGQYAVCEDEVDELLRAQVFVDLYSVTKQTLIAGIEKYSIKDLEQFYGFRRTVPLKDLAPHKRLVEHSLELHRTERISPEALRAVEGYNRDDCYSTVSLRNWLEELRAQQIKSGNDIPRPLLLNPDLNEETSLRQKAQRELRESLHAHLPLTPEERTPTQAAQWLLGNLVEFYRREDKVKYWEKFHLASLDATELLDEKAGLSGLKFLEQLPISKRVPVERYSFPPQEHDLRPGDDLYLEQSLDGAQIKAGTVSEIDYDNSTVDIKRNENTKGLKLHAVWAWKIFNAKEKENRIRDFAEYVQQHGFAEQGTKYKALRDLLQRRDPDLKTPVSATIPLERAIAMTRALDHSCLAIQGPPGTGKSYTASHIILDLIAQGFNVGVTATSHKVISNLLEAVLKNSKGRARGRVFQRNDDPESPDITYVASDGVESVLLAERGIVVGATDFTWARVNAERLDYIVIDEAGQYSLAGVTALGHVAKNIILLGDGAQLTQPLQGSHPEGADVSALDHIVGTAKTLPPEKGVFLEQTFRLHPNICAFVSELYYDNRLTAVAGNETQLVAGVPNLEQTQLALFEVTHQGRTSRCPEEVEAIRHLLNQLLVPGATFTRHQKTHPLTKADIKIIAPYNAQVNLLKRHFPDISIGTVDKFQGQEAAVVLYSVTTSSGADAPRGLDFLYSGNRLNVAVSRAECLFVMVASPRIFDVDCKTPAQMRLVNAYARYREVARKL